LALFILSTAIVAGLSAVNSGLSSTQVSKSKLIAANLNQEGIEIVRNIRDNNWLEQRTNPGLLWDTGLSSGDWEVTYQSQALESYQERYFKINSNGFYNYTSGTDTKFKRKITIQKITDDQLRIISKVEWEERGESYNLTAVSDLYNWLRGGEGEAPPPPPPPPCDCPACQQCDSYGQCIAAPNTNWGAGLYECTGAVQRCYNASCVTCDGYLASDGCNGCAGQGGNACWRSAAPYASCTTACSSYGGCVSANWNDDTSCTVMKQWSSCSEGCITDDTYRHMWEAPEYCTYGGSYVCERRLSQDQICNLPSANINWNRICVCNY
jgi:hypothetical protein